jgi:hypothetical protein
VLESQLALEQKLFQQQLLLPEQLSLMDEKLKHLTYPLSVLDDVLLPLRDRFEYFHSCYSLLKIPKKMDYRPLGR